MSANNTWIYFYISLGFSIVIYRLVSVTRISWWSIRVLMKAKKIEVSKHKNKENDANRIVRELYIFS